jgi:alanyl-tRNA synthetase
MTQRLYYDDSNLRSFSAVVTDVRERVRAQGQSLWEIALDQSAFYPTSGGQPFDLGTLSAVSRSGARLDAQVTEVTEDDAGEVWHCTAKPLNAGTAVTGEIDWSRRRDHMQQHSGQHLLSAVFALERNAATTSFHLGEESCSIDLALDVLDANEIARIEILANEIITEDRDVALRYVSREEAEALLAEGKLRKLPPREGVIRMVEMAGLDLNACGGTHVQSTGQIGAILLRRVEKIRGGMRVEFVCGHRAVRLARSEFNSLAESAALLSSSALQLPAAVRKLLDEAKAAERERWALLEQLAEFHAKELLQANEKTSGVRWVYHELPQHDLEYAKLLAAKLTSHEKNCAALLVCMKAEPAPVVLARSATSLQEFNAGVVLRESLAAFGARGGGSATLAQGAIPQAQRADLQRALAKLVGAIE